MGCNVHGSIVLLLVSSDRIGETTPVSDLRFVHTTK